MTVKTTTPQTTSNAILQWRSLKTRVTVFTLAFFLIGIWLLPLPQLHATERYGTCVKRIWPVVCEGRRKQDNVKIAQTVYITAAERGGDRPRLQSA
jgi:hypothetical protein